MTPFGKAVLQLQGTIDEIVEEMRLRTDRGTVANYIPELARADAGAFGIAVANSEGMVAAGGNSDQPFSIQSISKVFTLTMALGKVGDRLWQRVGREPSGSPFNSIVQLEAEHGIPRNPFINAGAHRRDRRHPFGPRAKGSARRDPQVHAISGR